MDAVILPLLVYFPDSPLAGRRSSLRLLAFQPAIGAWLVAPKIMTVGQHAAQFPPDDCLVPEQSHLPPGCLHERLAAGRVPLVDGGKRLKVLQRQPEEA